MMPISGFMHLVRYRRGQDIIREVPSSVATEFAPDLARARQIVEDALAGGEGWLSQNAVHDLLGCYRIPTPRLKLVAKRPKLPPRPVSLPRLWLLKIASPDILHKSDVGGVALNLETADKVRAGRRGDDATAVVAAPKARVHGLRRSGDDPKPRAHELIVGMAVDRQFRPVSVVRPGRNRRGSDQRQGAGVAAAQSDAGPGADVADDGCIASSKAIAIGRLRRSTTSR